MSHSHITLPGTWQLLLPSTYEGSLTLREQVFPFTPFTLFLLGQHMTPHLSALSSNDYYHLSLESKLLIAHSTPQTDFTKLCYKPFHVVTLTETQQKNTVSFLEKISENNGRFGSDVRRTLSILELLLYLTPLLSSESTIALPHPTNNHRIAPILDYIGENLSEPLCLDQIATHFYLSKHHLCRLFKSATGFTVMDYIIQCRISKASQLLQQGYSVQRTGELSGFSDNSHFIRTFGQIMNTSPGKYAKSFEHL